MKACKYQGDLSSLVFDTRCHQQRCCSSLFGMFPTATESGYGEAPTFSLLPNRAHWILFASESLADPTDVSR